MVSLLERIREQSRHWRRKVTVGIACQCIHNGEFAIALCCDWQATYGQVIKSEDQHKVRIAGRAAILIADDPAAADEVISRLTSIFEAYDKLDKPEADFDLRITKLLADIRGCLVKINAERRDHLLRVKYNTTSEFFRKEGKDNFPSDMYYNILSEIGKIGVGCDLIIAYNQDVEPIIIEISGADCGVHWVDDWTCIGSGSWIARAILVQDEQSDGPIYMDLMDCLAAIYSAKIASQKDPHVGKFSSILVLTRNQQIELTDEGWNYLKGKTPPIIPPKNLEFQKSFFMPSKL
jgi:hypothetical protein